jgi:very-short-patch-repair endonuclease
MNPELIIEAIIKENGLTFKKEVRFHDTRKWRFDYQIIDTNNDSLKLALEIDGAAFSRGRHTRGTGFSEDHIKFNQAVLLGWKVLRYTTNQIKDNPKMLDSDIKTLTK